MELEHYPAMTEKAIEAMIDEAHRRFDILGARVIHRVGLLQPLDQIMMVPVIWGPLVFSAITGGSVRFGGVSDRSQLRACHLGW